jgi:hypothetical protein
MYRFGLKGKNSNQPVAAAARGAPKAAVDSNAAAPAEAPVAKKKAAPKAPRARKARAPKLSWKAKKELMYDTANKQQTPSKRRPVDTAYITNLQKPEDMTHEMFDLLKKKAETRHKFYKLVKAYDAGREEEREARRNKKKAKEQEHEDRYKKHLEERRKKDTEKKATKPGMLKLAYKALARAQLIDPLALKFINRYEHWLDLKKAQKAEKPFVGYMKYAQEQRKNGVTDMKQIGANWKALSGSAKLRYKSSSSPAAAPPVVAPAAPAPVAAGVIEAAVEKFQKARTKQKTATAKRELTNVLKANGIDMNADQYLESIQEEGEEGEEAFGRRRRSSGKRKASFGRRRRSSGKKKTSFGRRRRSSGVRRRR